MNVLAPESLSQLPRLFAESVVDAASKTLGESTGEAFIRCIGDSKLRDPDAVYSRLDSFLGSGSSDMKKAIVRTFSSKVHLLHKLTMQVATSTPVS